LPRASLGTARSPVPGQPALGTTRLPAAAAAAAAVPPSLLAAAGSSASCTTRRPAVAVVRPSLNLECA
jgi:hypothetical protein